MGAAEGFGLFALMVTFMGEGLVLLVMVMLFITPAV